MAARVLYWLIQGIAAGLLGLVLLAPLVDAGSQPLLRLFAQDAMLRRTALASGIALLATARIFLRPPATVVTENRSRRPVPPPVIGA